MYLFFQRLRIVNAVAEFVEHCAPVQALHLAAVFGEGRAYPCDDIHEVGPQLVGIRVELVLRHVIVYFGNAVVPCRPFQNGGEVRLFDGRAVEEVGTELVGRAAGFREMAAGIRHEWAGVDSVQQLLVQQLFSGNVDDSEPVQLLFVRSLAEIDRQLVVQEFFFVLIGQRREIECVHFLVHNVEAVGEVLANRQGALLPVNHFKMAVFAHAPVHDIERETFQDGIYDRLLLFQVVPELTLIGRADVQLAAIALHAGIDVVAIAVYQVTDGYGLQFYLHILFLI